MSEILNTDGSRNWQANILQDEITRLKQENEKLKETCDGLLKIQYALADEAKKFEEALENIKERLKAVSYLAPSSTRDLKYAIEDIINEVLDERKEY